MLRLSGSVALVNFIQKSNKISTHAHYSQNANRLGCRLIGKIVFVLLAFSIEFYRDIGQISSAMPSIRIIGNVTHCRMQISQYDLGTLRILLTLRNELQNFVDVTPFSLHFQLIYNFF